MHVIHARNVNDAYFTGVHYLLRNGVKSESRAGDVLVAGTPVTTVYAQPCERVLFDPARDANPFLHLFESLWMLAGRDDAAFLNKFVGDFGLRFAESDGVIHGAYGHRWRKSFGYDQLDVVVQKLRDNPDDRQAVIGMWDASTTHGVLEDFLGVGHAKIGETPIAGSDDLRGVWKDRPCNTQIYLRVRSEQVSTGVMLLTDPSRPEMVTERYLDLTVCCRSNDVVWGAYGANAVHFSVLQEYLAGRIGVNVGIMYQVSNNYHGYSAVLDRIGQPNLMMNPYARIAPQEIGKKWDSWDDNLRHFMAWTESEEPDQDPQGYPLNPWFEHTAEPLYVAHMKWKAGERDQAMEIVQDREDTMAPDWREACISWMQRRIDKKKPVEEVRAK